MAEEAPGYIRVTVPGANGKFTTETVNPKDVDIMLLVDLAMRGDQAAAHEIDARIDADIRETIDVNDDEVITAITAPEDEA